MHLHWQNLNEKPGGRMGAILRYGRAWLWVGKDEHGSATRTLGWSWHFGFNRPSVSFDLREASSEAPIQLGIAFLFFAFHLHFVPKWGGWLHRWLPKRGRRFWVYVTDAWELSVTPWGREWEWKSADPWWIRGFYVRPIRWLLGEAVYSERVLQAVRTTIPMPEDNYEATVKIVERTWKRPRWFARRWISADIKPDRGIPKHGKGENSWDCGPDATYGLSCPCPTQSVADAVGAMVACVYRDRLRYGHTIQPPREAATA